MNSSGRRVVGAAARDVLKKQGLQPRICLGKSTMALAAVRTLTTRTIIGFGVGATMDAMERGVQPWRKGDTSRDLHTTKLVGFSSEESKEEAPPMFDNPRERILQNSLKHVKNLGWTVGALAEGANDIGYPSIAHGMFPRGSIELVEYFMEKANKEMSQIMAENASGLEKMSVSDRLQFGVKTRLQLLAPFIDKWPEAMALGALPQNASTTMRRLALMSDEIWYFAGDRSTDMSWYTKRAILTGIYVSTELFMLTDQSPGLADTWSFLARRVDDAVILGEIPQNTQDLVGMLGLGVQSILASAGALASPLISHAISKSPAGSMVSNVAQMGYAGISQVMQKNASFTAPSTNININASTTGSTTPLATDWNQGDLGKFKGDSTSKVGEERRSK